METGPVLIPKRELLFGKVDSSDTGEDGDLRMEDAEDVGHSTGAIDAHLQDEFFVPLVIGQEIPSCSEVDLEPAFHRPVGPSLAKEGCQQTEPAVEVAIVVVD